MISLFVRGINSDQRNSTVSIDDAQKKSATKPKTLAEYM